jgi:hypothetical protein
MRAGVKYEWQLAAERRARHPPGLPVTARVCAWLPGCRCR